MITADELNAYIKDLNRLKEITALLDAMNAIEPTDIIVYLPSGQRIPNELFTPSSNAAEILYGFCIDSLRDEYKSINKKFNNMFWRTQSV